MAPLTVMPPSVVTMLAVPVAPPRVTALPVPVPSLQRAGLRLVDEDVALHAVGRVSSDSWVWMSWPRVPMARADVSVARAVLPTRLSCADDVLSSSVVVMAPVVAVTPMVPPAASVDSTSLRRPPARWRRCCRR